MCSLIANLSSLPLSLSIVSSSSSSSSSKGTDGKPNSKSVKLREDWRQRSKPIPPGGTYPAKDHCRSISKRASPFVFPCKLCISVLTFSCVGQSLRIVRHILHCPCQGSLCFFRWWDVQDWSKLLFLSLFLTCLNNMNWSFTLEMVDESWCYFLK